MITPDNYLETHRYRLAHAELFIPSLGERMEDVAVLVARFAARAERPARFTLSAVEALKSRDWPGNVRQLKAVVERLALFSTGVVDEDAVLRDGSPRSRTAPTRRPVLDSPTLVRAVIALPGGSLRSKLGSLERDVIRATLQQQGSLSKAAFALGMTRKTLRSKLSVAS